VIVPFRVWALLIVIGGAVAWYFGGGAAVQRAYPTLATDLLTNGTRLGWWLLATATLPWDFVSTFFPEPWGELMRSTNGHLFLLFLGIWFLAVWFRGRGGRPGMAGAPKKERRRQGPPHRVPFLDRPKRPLVIGRDRHGRPVVADMSNSHGFAAAGTRSGKSTIMRTLVDAPSGEAVLAPLFDISLPVVARFRYWQAKALRGDFVVDGKVPPVIVWRPNPPRNDPDAVCLRILEGPALEVMSRLQQAFKASTNSVGDWRARARDRGVVILEQADRDGKPRCLDLLIAGLTHVAHDPKEDRETRLSCWQWQSKLTGLKSMLGDAEGPYGLNPLDILSAGGKLAMELNNFAVAEAAGALGPLILGLAIWAVDSCPRPVTVLMDEGNQLGDRVADVDKLYTAAGARDGRCFMCAQKPLKFVKELATNIDVWVLGGFGGGAVQEREWASKVVGGVVDPDGFIKVGRTVASRLMRRFGKLHEVMNLEVYVRHEATTEGPVQIDNPWPEMVKYLHHTDWPRNRAKIKVAPGILEPDPFEPTDPPDGPPPAAGPDPSEMPATAKRRTRPSLNSSRRPVTTGTIVRKASTGVNGTDSGTAKTTNPTKASNPTKKATTLKAGGPPAWVEANADALRWWASLSGTNDPKGLWLWTGPKNLANGRPKSSRVVSGEELARLRERNPNARASQSCSVYPEMYVLAGCPNGPVFDGCSFDHLAHGKDETCSGGKDCIHVLDCNPWNIEPVTPAVQAQRRDAQRALHDDWRMKQGLPPLERSVDRAATASVKSRMRVVA
jgi:hypothetical protein